MNYVITTKFGHAMSVGLLPAGAIEAIDKHHRAFLRTGEEAYTGGQCKVAWDDVSGAKDLGGMGILSLSYQNTALLSKFLTKLPAASNAPGPYGFVVNMAGRPAGTWESHFMDCPTWKGIVAALPSFHHHSYVIIF